MVVKTRRTNIDLVRISATLSRENRQWLESRAESLGVSVSALLDSIILLCRKRSKS